MNSSRYLFDTAVCQMMEVIAETSVYFEDLDKSYYKDGIEKLEHRWIKCIILKEDYVEK